MLAIWTLASHTVLGTNQPKINADFYAKQDSEESRNMCNLCFCFPCFSCSQQSGTCAFHLQADGPSSHWVQRLDKGVKCANFPLLIFLAEMEKAKAMRHSGTCFLVFCMMQGSSDTAPIGLHHFRQHVSNLHIWILLHMKQINPYSQNKPTECRATAVPSSWHTNFCVWRMWLIGEVIQISNSLSTV